MPQFRILGPASLIAVTLLAPGQGLAQDATPTARETLPPCTAEPRDINELVGFWFSPSGEPAATPTYPEPITDDEALPAGERLDDVTVKAITETTLGWISCMEGAGQYARGFSFMTDDLLAQFGPDTTNPAQDSPEEVRAALEGQLAGTPIAGQMQNAAMPPPVGPRKPRLLEDGRAAAIWSFGGDRVYLVYEEVDGRWLIDAAEDILDVEGTPTP